MEILHSAVAILAAILLIIRFKVDPVISLLLACIYLGLTTGRAPRARSGRSPAGSARSWPRSACSSASASCRGYWTDKSDLDQDAVVEEGRPHDETEDVPVAERTARLSLGVRLLPILVRWCCSRRAPSPGWPTSPTRCSPSSATPTSPCSSGC